MHNAKILIQTQRINLYHLLLYIIVALINIYFPSICTAQCTWAGMIKSIVLNVNNMHTGMCNSQDIYPG